MPTPPTTSHGRLGVPVTTAATPDGTTDASGGYYYSTPDGVRHYQPGSAGGPPPPPPAKASPAYVPLTLLSQATTPLLNATSIAWLDDAKTPADTLSYEDARAALLALPATPGLVKVGHVLEETPTSRALASFDPAAVLSTAAILAMAIDAGAKATPSERPTRITWILSLTSSPDAVGAPTAMGSLDVPAVGGPVVAPPVGIPDVPWTTGEKVAAGAGLVAVGAALVKVLPLLLK